MTLVELLVLILATECVTNLLINEAGPGEIFRNLRKLLRAGEFRSDAPDFDEFTEEELDWWLSTDKVAPGFVSDLFSCQHCLSVWVGMLFGWSYWLYRPTVFIVLPFALSAGALLFYPKKTEEDVWQEQT